VSASLPPFKVARDGCVTDRAAGHVIGWVWLESDGWTARDLERVPVARRYPNGRKYAARAVWDDYRAKVDAARAAREPEEGTPRAEAARPPWWPTAEDKLHADAGCAHPDRCNVRPPE